MKPAVLLLSALMLVSCGSARMTGASQGRESDFIRNIETLDSVIPYQQDSLMLVDPAGDAHLIRRLDTIPALLLHLVVKGSLPQAGSRTEEQYRIRKTIPIDIDRLQNQFSQIIRRHYPDIEPVRGQEHEWSPEAKRYLRYGFWHRLHRYANYDQAEFPTPLFARSKLFLCLACGWSSRYCATGQEKALEERILQRPDRSVQIHELFEESYILNNGNIYLTLLTCENMLAAYPHRKDRDNDPLQKKLAYIRHDSKEIGDNYGAWYHFFGIALYGFVRRDFVSRFVANTESLGSLILEGADTQERYMNHYGVIFGQKLKRMIKDGTWRSPLQETDRTDYMLPNTLFPQGESKVRQGAQDEHQDGV